MAVTSTRKQKSARNPRRRSRRRSPRSPQSRRWLVVPLALGVAALALYVLVTAGARAPVATGPPLDDIDAASRARLEQVIRDAELREEPAR